MSTTYPIISVLGAPAIHRTDWQGRQLLYPTPRTNLCGYNAVYAAGAFLPNWAAYYTPAITTGILAPDGSHNAIQVADNSGGTAASFGMLRENSPILTGTHTVVAALRSTSSAGQTVQLGCDDATSVAVPITDTWQVYQVIVTGGYNYSELRYFQLHSNAVTDPPFQLYLPGTFAGSVPGALYPQATTESLTDYALTGTTVNLAQVPATGAILDWTGTGTYATVA